MGSNTEQTVTYDALGNITYKSDVGSYIYGISKAGPHAVSYAGGDNFTNDANGNLVRESRDGTITRRLGYTTFNKVKRIVKGERGQIAQWTQRQVETRNALDEVIRARGRKGSYHTNSLFSFSLYAKFACFFPLKAPFLPQKRGRKISMPRRTRATT